MANFLILLKKLKQNFSEKIILGKTHSVITMADGKKKIVTDVDEKRFVIKQILNL